MSKVLSVLISSGSGRRGAADAGTRERGRAVVAWRGCARGSRGPAEPCALGEEEERGKRGGKRKRRKENGKRKEKRKKKEGERRKRKRERGRDSRRRPRPVAHARRSRVTRGTRANKADVTAGDSDLELGSPGYREIRENSRKFRVRALRRGRAQRRETDLAHDLI